jgi:DNA-binding GntR family transcriptional regulator
MEIDHGIDTPVWRQLADILRAQIDSGELQERRAIPTKKVLIERHGISGDTVDKATAQLREEGYIRLVFGRGLFVVPAADRGAKSGE